MIESLLLYIASTPLSVALPVTVGITIVVSLVGTYLANEIFTYRELAANNEVVGIKFGYFGEIFAVSLGLALIGSYSLYMDVREVASNEVSAMRSLYYSVSDKSEIRSPQGAIIMRNSIVNYAQSVVDDEWPQQAKGIMNERTTQRVMEMYDALIAYGDKNVLNASQATWIGEIVQMRGLRTSTSSRTVAQFVWAILFAGVMLSIFLPLLIGTQNFLIHALISTLFSTFIMLHLLAIVYLSHPFNGEVGVTAGLYLDFIAEAKRLSLQTP